MSVCMSLGTSKGTSMCLSDIQLSTSKIICSYTHCLSIDLQLSIGLSICAYMYIWPTSIFD